MPCVRLDCPHYRLHGESRRHGYCCNACRCGEGEHTKNCSGCNIHKRDYLRSRSPPLIADANQLPMGRPPVRGPSPPLLAYTSLNELPVLRSSENVHPFLHRMVRAAVLYVHHSRGELAVMEEIHIGLV